MVRAMTFDEFLSSGQQELRRGTVVLACLLLLREPGYGKHYELKSRYQFSHWL